MNKKGLRNSKRNNIRTLHKTKRVILVKTNPIEYDLRLPKEIKTLKRGGYSTTVLCWDRDCNITKPELQGDEIKDYKEIRIRIKAPRGIRVLFFLPIWWCVELFKLMVERWDVVHAIDFDSVVPAIIASKLKKKPLVYEILETYEDEILLPKVIRDIAIKIDKLLMRLASSVILADDMQIEGFGGVPNSKVVTVYDSPPDILGRTDIGHQKSDNFILFYDGVIHKARRLNLDKLFTAIRSIEGVKLVMTGRGDQVEEIKKWSIQMPQKIQFVGWVSYDEVLERTITADLLFVIPDPIVPLNKYIGGSKLLKAMMCGKPILANKGTLAASMVREENCGLVIDANNIEEIEGAITKLRDNPELCKEFGANGRNAYEQRYSWGIMERRLITLYQELNDEIRQENKKA